MDSSRASLFAAECASTFQPLHTSAGSSRSYQQQVTALLEGVDRGCRADALLSMQPALQVQQVLTPAQVVQEYTDSLQRSAAAEAAADTRITALQAAIVCQELNAFLQARQAARGVSLLTCSPVEVKVGVLESQCLRQHGSTMLSDGHLHAVPSYLNTAISHLSGLFKRLGCNGEYDLWCNMVRQS